MTFPWYLCPYHPEPSIPQCRSHLLHIRTRPIRLRIHRHALDALLARVVGRRVNACVRCAGVGGDWCLARALLFGVAGCVGGACAVL